MKAGRATVVALGTIAMFLALAALNQANEAKERADSIKGDLESVTEDVQEIKDTLNR